MKILKVSDLTTRERSVDLTSDLYFYEDKILRAIKDDYVDYVKTMLSNGFIDELVQKRLFPKTKISNMEVEGYSLVVEHENIVYWNYPYEWSFGMLKDAALLILEVNNIANKYNYQIMDAHYENVTFNINKPQYVDLGSFIKYDKKRSFNWESYFLFYNSFYIPLYLWSKDYPEIARNFFLARERINEQEVFNIRHPILSLLIGEYGGKIARNIRVIALTSKVRIRSKINNPLKKIIALSIHKIIKKKFTSEKARRQICKIKRPNEKTLWRDYHNNIKPDEKERFIRIAEIISTLTDAVSMLEVASNQGKFAQFVIENTHLEMVIASDYDRQAVDTMYQNCKNNDQLLSMLFNVIRQEGRACDKAINERIKGDVVVALAVTHHLILTQRIPIDYIFKQLSSFSNKYVIVEFMPIGLYSGDINNIPELPDYYNLNWFKDNFKKYFDLILDEKLEINRHVFIGKIKKI